MPRYDVPVIYGVEATSSEEAWRTVAELTLPLLGDRSPHVEEPVELEQDQDARG